MHRKFTKALALALPLPGNSIVPLWDEDELVSGDFMEGAFPIMENAFEVGTDLLVNAYGSKAYAVANPSEVLLQTGEVKSITLLEMPAHSFAYKVRYRDDAISFGHVSLRGEDAGSLICDHFSTNAMIGYMEAAPDVPLEVVRKWTEADHEKFDRNLIRIGGGEYALVAAIARDFFVCEERDTHYTVQSTPRTQRKSRLGIKIRYLPRFRVRYVGLREQEYRSQRVQVVGHHVCGHLRRCKTASPLQLRLANQFNVEVPDGFTFVQPHDRGGHSRVLYRSRSALRMIYGEAIEHTTETQK